MRQKNADGKTWYPKLCIVFVENSLCWKTEGFLIKFFSTVRLKNFDGKSWCALFMHKVFRYPNCSETLKSCPLNFSALSDKKFPTEKRDTPPLIHNFYPYWKLSVVTKVFSYNFLPYWQTKQFQMNGDTPKIQNCFETTNFLKHKGHPKKKVRYCETEKFSPKFVVPHLSYASFLFLYRNFLKHRRFPPRGFSVLWDSKYSTKNCDTLPLSIIFFSY